MAWQNVIARDWGTRRRLLAHSAIVAVAVGSLLGSGEARAANAGVQTAVATVGPMPASAPVSLDLFLPSVDPKGAADFVAHVSKPGDPLFHHYLTPVQYAARFGAKPADYAAVIAWAKSQGMTVRASSVGRHVISVSGPSSMMAAALGVTFTNYRDAKGRIFYSASGGARLPDRIAPMVAGVVGLSSAAQYKPLVKPIPAGAGAVGTGTGPMGGYLAADLRSIYQIPTLNFGSKTQTIAVFEQGGFDPNDVAVYLKKNGLPNVPVVVRNVNGYGGGIDDLNVEVEAVLDIDMVIGMNPQAKQVLVYEEGTSNSFPTALLNGLSAMATDDTAQTISISYGLDEAESTPDALNAENAVLTELAAQGQAVFASAGDNGALGDNGTQTDLRVEDPGSQPMLTGVGGTTLLNGPAQSYKFEFVWNDIAASGGGTGGGVSAMWPIPAYQTGAQPALNGGSNSFRNVPDVTAVGDPLTGVAVYSKLGLGGWGVVGGTSVGAPLWAGFDSLIDTTLEGFGLGQAGFMNPTLYGIAYNGFIAATNLHDIVEGNNGTDFVGFGFSNPSAFAGFEAGPFYDDTSGLGSMVGGNLLVDFAVSAVGAGKTAPAAPTDLQVAPTATSATLTWAPAPTATGYLVEIQTTGANERLILETVSRDPAVTIPKLTPKTTYEVMLYSISNGGVAEAPIDLFATPAAVKAAK